MIERVKFISYYLQAFQQQFLVDVEIEKYIVNGSIFDEDYNIVIITEIGKFTVYPFKGEIYF